MPLFDLNPSSFHSATAENNVKDGETSAAGKWIHDAEFPALINCTGQFVPSRHKWRHTIALNVKIFIMHQ